MGFEMEFDELREHSGNSSSVEAECFCKSYKLNPSNFQVIEYDFSHNV